MYGYYTGTITLENATVNRVEPGLTTYSYANIGLESAEDTVTKINSTNVNFQLVFADSGDSFRVYYDIPATANSVCSASTSTTTPQL